MTACSTHDRSRGLALAFRSQPATATFGRYRSTVECPETELEGLEADMTTYFDVEPFCDPLTHLSANRGVGRLGALVLEAKVRDWRRFSGRNVEGAFCELVGSEYFSGSSVVRGGLTHAGNMHLLRQLVEST